MLNTVSHVDTVMSKLGKQAKIASHKLAVATEEQKNTALLKAAQSVRINIKKVLKENSKDVLFAKEKGISKAFIDRLELNVDRLENIAQSIEKIADFPDPVGTIMAEWERPNGLQISRVRTPLGVIGVIFESRPNVAADAGALCLKSGNAVILRGGSDSFHSVHAIHACLIEGLQIANLPETAIQIVPTVDRGAVGSMLSGLDGTLDVIVPRGGKRLVERVRREARVPIFAHLEGLCHMIIDKSADLNMARQIVINAKMRRPGICGALETLLVDRHVVETHLDPIVKDLQLMGCKVRGDETVCKMVNGVELATEDDWRTEYLDAIISIRIVEDLEEALLHIHTYSSHHTEAIISEDLEAVKRFFNEIDSAILLHNASTQFADGGEFGMGAEIGIATGKMHARGPVGLEQLTSFKYQVRGDGQIRP